MERKQSSSWDVYWKSGANLEYWLEPDQSVVELARKLNRSEIRDVLDLGCGMGRHSLWLANAGYNVTAVDVSVSALDHLKEEAQNNPRVRTVIGSCTQDLFREGSFDLVLSWNVLYHGTRGEFESAIRLIYRWLRPNGLLLFTCPTRQDAKYGNGQVVAPNAYRSLNSVHPGDIHYFADEADLGEFLVGFNRVSTEKREHYWDNNGVRQFSSYWIVLARKNWPS